MMMPGLTLQGKVPRKAKLETKELDRVTQFVDSEQSKDSEFRSRYYKEALHYLNRFLERDLCLPLDDG